MSKAIKKATLAGLLVLLPVMGNAQDCYPSNNPATTPTGQFTSYGNGTVTDNKTGLMWKTCGEGQVFNSSNQSCDNTASVYTWQNALKQVQTVNSSGGFAGFSDWRVPNIKELDSITELQCVSPAINLMVFPNTDTNSPWFWSSTPGLWAVHFGYGQNQGGVSGSLHVRLVRGGQ